MRKASSKWFLRAVAGIFGTLLSLSSAIGQIPGATPDTVKLRILDVIPEPNPTFSVEILVSLDSAVRGGTLGFSWNDTANWQYDSTVFGPVLLSWAIHTTFITTLSNGNGAVLIGGARIFAAPFPAGPDQNWATMFFSLKLGRTISATDLLLIDSTFVPTNGDFLLVYDRSLTGIIPNFVGPLEVLPSLLFFGECCNRPGDANNDGNVNIADVTFLIARIFAGGQAPRCCAQADANGSGSINIADITFLIALIFSGGPIPICGAGC